MFKLRFVIPIIAVAAALAATAFAPRAFSLVQSGSARHDAPPVKYTMTQKKVELSPIVVYGHHFSFVAALQMYKKALTRSWSSDDADLDKLVCKWHARLGTHAQTLRCATNRQHLKQYDARQLALSNSSAKVGPNGGGPASLYQALVNGALPLGLAGFSNQKHLDRSTFVPLLKKLPPANASYTLRITGDNDKPILDYVFKHGDLTHIYHYVYKKGQSDNK